MNPIRQWIHRPLLKRKMRDSEFAHLFEPYQGDECVSIDCETTGLNPKTADILTIGAVMVKDNRVLTSQKCEQHFAPTEALCGESIKVHRIRRQDLPEEDNIPEQLTELLNFIGNRPILGYNIRFDFTLLNRYVKSYLGFQLTNPLIELGDCYQQQALKAVPGAYVDLNFERIANQLGVPIMGRHSALGDAITTALMYVRLKKGPALKEV